MVLGALVRLGADELGRLRVHQACIIVAERPAHELAVIGPAHHLTVSGGADWSSAVAWDSFCEHLGRYSRSLARWPLTIVTSLRAPIKSLSYITPGGSP